MHALGVVHIPAACAPPAAWIAAGDVPSRQRQAAQGRWCGVPVRVERVVDAALQGVYRAPVKRPPGRALRRVRVVRDDRVTQAARRVRHRDRAVVHRVHLVQAARLKAARHEQDVGGRGEAVREGHVEADPAARRVGELGLHPLQPGLEHRVAGAEAHQLHVLHTPRPPSRPLSGSARWQHPALSRADTAMAAPLQVLPYAHIGRGCRRVHTYQLRAVRKRHGVHASGADLHSDWVDRQMSSTRQRLQPSVSQGSQSVTAVRVPGRGGGLTWLTIHGAACRMRSAPFCESRRPMNARSGILSLTGSPSSSCRHRRQITSRHGIEAQADAVPQASTPPRVPCCCESSQRPKSLLKA